MSFAELYNMLRSCKRGTFLGDLKKSGSIQLLILEAGSVIFASSIYYSAVVTLFKVHALAGASLQPVL